MKFVSWNVNGLRACLKKNFMESFKKLDADIIGLQEIKMQTGDIILELDNYKQIWNCGERKGYSGVAVFTRIEPKNIIRGIEVAEYDREGRVIILEFEKFYFLNVYVPNSHNLEWLTRRMHWEDHFREYLRKLGKLKPVIACGDFNVAHQSIDLKNPSTNHHSAGFSNEERQKFSELLQIGFIDVFRHFYPNVTGAYTWWSYLRKARSTNSGWRIDYFLVSKRFINEVIDTTIEKDIFGSDHCPITLIIK